MIYYVYVCFVRDLGNMILIDTGFAFSSTDESWNGCILHKYAKILHALQIILVLHC